MIKLSSLFLALSLVVGCAGAVDPPCRDVNQCDAGGCWTQVCEADAAAAVDVYPMQHDICANVAEGELIEYCYAGDLAEAHAAAPIHYCNWFRCVAEVPLRHCEYGTPGGLSIDADGTLVRCH